MFQLGTSIFFVLTVPQVVAIVERCNEHGRHSWRIFPAYGQFLGGSISYTGGDVGGKMMVCILYISFFLYFIFSLFLSFFLSFFLSLVIQTCKL